MTPFTISDNGWSFSEIEEKADSFKDPVPRWAVPYIASPEAMKNYSDDVIYEADKRIREFIESMRGKWSKHGNDRRFQFGDLCKLLGLDEVVRKRKNYAAVSRVFAYYSNRTYSETTINGEKKKNVYKISPARLKRQPYSLRLRIEMLQEGGAEEVHHSKLSIPKDDLQPKGDARNPRTKANSELRKEEAKRAYNEYKKQRAERFGKASEERDGSR